MEKPDIQSSSVESKEFFAGIKVILKENNVYIIVVVFLSIATADSPQTRRRSECGNCELKEYVVHCSELKFTKKQKGQSCFCDPHVLKVPEG